MDGPTSSPPISARPGSWPACDPPPGYAAGRSAADQAASRGAPYQCGRASPASAADRRDSLSTLADRALPMAGQASALVSRSHHTAIPAQHPVSLLADRAAARPGTRQGEGLVAALIGTLATTDRPTRPAGPGPAHQATGLIGAAQIAKTIGSIAAVGNFPAQAP